MEAFIRRLKERKLVQWALAYCAGAFALVQLADIVANRFHWPESVMRWGILALLLGFGITLVLAWFHGDRGQQRVSAMELSIFAALLLAAAVGVAMVRPGGAPRAQAASGNALPEKTVAVLPFRSLSDSSNNANFADGIHDELLTQLSRISDLQVISRVSVMQYRNTTKPLRQIAQELGAGSILTGSVQRAGGQVRIEAELIDARTDRHVWAETYTRAAGDVFTVETEVARGIAQALNAALTAREQAALSGAAHTTPDVYDLYLRGREHLSVPIADEAETAERLLERAVQMDPAFADGWGALALAYEYHSASTELYIPGFRGQKGAREALAERGRATAAHALTLRGGVADARVALGWYQYWTRNDPRAALREFDLARQAAPSNEAAWSGIMFMQQAAGRWSEALAAGRKAVALNPRGGFGAYLLASGYASVWRYGEAVQTVRQLIARAPENGQFLPLIAYYQFEVDGDTARLRKALDALPERDTRTFARVGASGRLTDSTSDLLQASRQPAFVDGVNIVAPRALLRAYVHAGWGNAAAAAAEYDSARVILEAAVHGDPRQPRFRTGLAWAYAGLGRRADAIRQARMAVALCPEARDANKGPTYVREMAATFAPGGSAERDSAFRLLDHLVRVPNGVTRVELRFNDSWDSLRSDPRFPRLLAIADSVQPGPRTPPE